MGADRRPSCNARAVSPAVPFYSIIRETNVTIMHKYELNQALCACYDGRLRRRVQAVFSQCQNSHHEDVSAFVATIFPPFPIFTRRHGNQLTSQPTVTHMHRGAWWDTLPALKVIREEYVIISVENCVKPWQNNLKASCETAECPRNALTNFTCYTNAANTC